MQINKDTVDGLIAARPLRSRAGRLGAGRSRREPVIVCERSHLGAFLELSHISKRFGGVRALDDVDLTLEAGEVHCLVGENGSGKSTLIKIISGVQPPGAGRPHRHRGPRASRI